MRGADGEARMAGIDAGEVDELLKRLAQRLGRVVAGVVRAKGHMGAEKGAWIGLEEAGDAGRERRPGGERVGDAGEGRQRSPQARALDAPPELLEPVKTILDLVAGDDARIDGADRGADQPVR